MIALHQQFFDPSADGFNFAQLARSGNDFQTGSRRGRRLNAGVFEEFEFQMAQGREVGARTTGEGFEGELGQDFLQLFQSGKAFGKQFVAARRGFQGKGQQHLFGTARKQFQHFVLRAGEVVEGVGHH